MNRARTGLWGALVWLLQPHLGLPGQRAPRAPRKRHPPTGTISVCSQFAVRSSQFAVRSSQYPAPSVRAIFVVQFAIGGAN